MVPEMKNMFSFKKTKCRKIDVSDVNLNMKKERLRTEKKSIKIKVTFYFLPDTFSVACMI